MRVYQRALAIHVNRKNSAVFCSLWGWGAVDFAHPMFLCGFGWFFGLGCFLGSVGMGGPFEGMLDGTGWDELIHRIKPYFFILRPTLKQVG
jgi:hypothetical protein